MSTLLNLISFLLALSASQGFTVSPVGGARKLRLRSAPEWLPELVTQDLTEDDYCAIGLACFFRTTADNKLEEDWVVEPLTSGTLETIDLGVSTSYKRVKALRLGDFFGTSPDKATSVDESAIKDLTDGYNFRICEHVVARTLSSARTFRRRVEAQLMEVGEVADDFNFSTEKKRISNEVYEPSFDDNVKQDASIDVYGRSSESTEALDEEIARLSSM